MADPAKVLYRYASKAAHPDAGGSNEAMVAVNAAYDALKGAPATRATGDAFHGPPRPYAADLVMPFGKHRGRLMGSLPLDYLTWMAESMDEPRWRRRAEQVLRWKA